MKNTTLSFITIEILFCLTSLLYSQNDLQSKLRSIPGIISIERIEPDSEYVEAFKIFFEQPVDHTNPEGDKFKQKFYLSPI